MFQFGVAVVTRAGESELSDYLINRTLPDAPGSLPRDLSVSRTADSRMVRLTWKQPLKANGPIDFYQIRYSYRNFKDKDVQDETTSKDLKAFIRDLEVDLSEKVFYFISNQIKTRN